MSALARTASGDLVRRFAAVLLIVAGLGMAVQAIFLAVAWSLPVREIFCGLMPGLVLVGVGIGELIACRYD